MKRLSTLTFARRACARLDNGAKLREALDLALVADILETMDARRGTGARFFILGCYQSFKTALAQLFLAHNHWTHPGPVGWYGPTDKFSKKFVEEKLNPLLEAIFLGKDSEFLNIVVKQTALYWKFVSGFHYILSANIENDRTGATYRDIYFDEPHRYEPGWIEQCSNRRGSYNESKEFTETFMSTGLTEGEGATGSEAVGIWKSTDQRTWHVRCPACRKFFEPRYSHREKEDDDESPIIGGIMYKKAFDAEGLPDRNAIADTLHHKCPRCGDVLPDHQSSRLLLSGTIDKPRGLYVLKNANPHRDCIGWNFGSITLRPWIDTAFRFEKAQLAFKRGDIEPLGLWVREEMGGIWIPEKHLRKKKATPIGLTPYKLGEDWADEARDYLGRPVRALTCDVQLDRFIFVIRMWAKDGRSRLRYCGIVTTPSRIRDIAMEHGVIPDRVYLDARHEPDYVKKVGALFGWRVFMGEKDKDYYHAETGLRRIFSEARPTDAFAGTAHGKGVVLLYMFSKQSALSRLQIIRTTETTNGDLGWTIATDAPEWYKKEIDAHYRIKKVTPEGQEYFVWHGHHDDHAGDCEAMQVVFASMAGLIGSESLETTAQNQKAA